MSYVCSVCAEPAGDDPLRCSICKGILCDNCAEVAVTCQPCRDQTDRRPDGSIDTTAARARREAKRERGV